jgi:hypothetical protein
MRSLAILLNQLIPVGVGARKKKQNPSDAHFGVTIHLKSPS